MRQLSERLRLRLRLRSKESDFYSTLTSTSAWFTHCGLVVSCEEVRQAKFEGLSLIELRGFRRQDARDLEVSEDHFRGSIEGLVVGALESVAINRRAS